MVIISEKNLSLRIEFKQSVFFNVKTAIKDQENLSF